MEELWKKQISTMLLINNFRVNFGKTGKTNQTVGYTKTRIELLKAYWLKFQQQHDQLSTMAEDKDLQADYFIKDKYNDIENTFCETLGYLTDLLDEKSSSATNQNNNSTSSLSTLGSNLPKINIPTFSGDYLSWMSFRDLFTSIVHNAPISKVDKLSHLKGHVTGDAALLLKNIGIQESNYDVAWEALKKRYENKRIITMSYLRKFTTLQPSKGESTSEVRRLLDTTRDMLDALRNLERPVDDWDDWIIFHLTSKLDPLSRRDWEVSIGSDTDIPKSKTLLDFMENRLRTLESICGKSDSSKLSGQQLAAGKAMFKSHHVASANKCIICAEKHILTYCSQFRSQSIPERRALVQKAHLCFNCLRSDHSVSTCPSASRCKQCKRKHHTMIHQPIESPPTLSTTPTSSECEANEVNDIQSHHTQQVILNDVLLATAWVMVRSVDGKYHKLRALLDQGSQASFISECAVQLLGIQKVRVNIKVCGLSSQNLGEIRNLVNIQIASCYNQEFKYPVQALIIDHVSSYSPSKGVSLRKWDHLHDLPLADPHYNHAGRIDLLLGADIFSQIVIEGIEPSKLGSPLAQNTTLGWILSGNTAINGSIRKCSLTVNIPKGGFDECSCLGLEQQLRRFWSLEDVHGDVPFLSKDEKICEAFFSTTYKRATTGRYVVRLPCKPTLEKEDFSQTRQHAIRLLLHTERRFEKDRALREHYTKFMGDYLSLRHMEEVSEQGGSSTNRIAYLPHHAVATKDTESTKFRVVFNGSYRLPNGVSLNDCLYVGPKLQRSLPSIVTQWRLHKVVFKADIEKMYRQIQVDRRDCDLQRIVWRNPHTGNIVDYRLLTNTYGLGCAPYLAIKSIHQLVEDDGAEFLDAAKILLEETYVDDILSGGSSISQALQRRDDLIKLLKGGGFTLKKWASNEPEVLAGLSEDLLDSKVSLSSKVEGIKALGLHWSSKEDTFSYSIEVPSQLSTNTTKREVLGSIAKLYDPLGWLAPTIILGKIFLQKLWSTGLNWDDPLPRELQSEFTSFFDHLRSTHTIKLDRWIGTHANHLTCELHGYSDASSLAYSAVVYARVTHEDGSVQVSLLMAKTKVAPLKATSIPRLELCGAVLLSRLIKEIRQISFFKTAPTTAWSDSTVNLAWIRGEPRQWKTFVANRVAEIQDVVDCSHWRYVPSEDNPADCASRGLLPDQLALHSIWWTGPSWLKQRSTKWPSSPLPDPSKPWSDEKKSITSHITRESSRWSILTKYSSLGKLVRIVAYCWRFIQNCKQPLSKRKRGYLRHSELVQAELTCIKLDQHYDFPDEVSSLKLNKPISNRSPLIKLAVWVDTDGLLRVGGRLQEARIDFGKKHPFILSKTSFLSRLVIARAHMMTLHGGVQTTLSYTRQRFWILGARNEVRKYIHRCIICHRHTTKAAAQLMGNLPAPRVQSCRPFLKSGVDYAGPIPIRQKMGRRITHTKGYICVFVCLATRAIHLELASDMSTAAFIAAYKRFTSRRGICSDLYSDCGSNFIGADRELRKSLVHFNQENNATGTELASMGTTWHFIPPGSPHFGGIWEAAVKSTKHHLRRILLDRALSYEELSTLLSQIEAILNSRPLMPLRDDPLDSDVLTPAHFLIGQPLTSIPEPDLCSINPNRLSRWQLIQQLFQHFWNKWSSDYLHQLQQRPKWTTRSSSIRPGQLVLVKDDRLPPSKWSLARVEVCHPGPDGLIRVVTLRTSLGSFKRSIAKICPLPLDQDNNNPENIDNNNKISSQQA